MDESHKPPHAPQEGVAIGKSARPMAGWNDPFISSKIPKIEPSEKFDLDFEPGAEFEDSELRIGEFTRGHGSHTAEHWTAAASLPGFNRETFNSNNLSVSPESSETTTPPAVSDVLERALRGPRLNEDLMLPSSDGLGAGVEEFWDKKIESFQSKLDENLHLPFPGLNPGLATLPSLRSLPSLSHGFLSQSLPSYGAQLPPYMPPTSQPIPLGKDQASPPPTAGSNSSSGSSAPFIGGTVFDHNSTNWRGFNANHAYYPDWSHVGTCDPRGITTPKYDLAGPEHTLLMSMSSTPHLQSPAHSDMTTMSSEAQDGAFRRARGRTRRSDSVVEATAPYVPSVPPSEVFRPKKKNGEENAGMGLDDIDERTLQFTSRQDAKPTRTLRRQCFNCRTWRDVSAWRRSVMQAGHIVCNKCGLYEKAHKKARPLNERGEFVRPGKHIAKLSIKSGIGRVQPKSTSRDVVDSDVLGTGVMKFEASGEDVLR